MNILHVVESLEVGGLERVVIALAGKQVSEGNTVHIACLYKEGALAGQARANGVVVHCCAKKHGLDMKAVRRMRQCIKDFRPDVVHSHNAASLYYAVLAGLGLSGKVHVNTRHGMGQSNFSWRREGLYRLALARARYAVAVCQMACDGFIQRNIFPLAKARVVRNGIQLQEFMSLGAQRDIGRQCAFWPDGNGFVFGTIGRLSVAKNHAFLLEAFREVVLRHPESRLLIVGDGALRSGLEALAAVGPLAGKVKFLGERSDIPALLQAMDAFVLSSDTEGYSLALVEAAAAGLPIICTKVGGNEEIVQDGVRGLTVPARDSGAMVEAMERLVSQPELGSRLGASARTWASENGSLESMHEAYLALYRGGA